MMEENKYSISFPEFLTRESGSSGTATDDGGFELQDDCTADDLRQELLKERKRVVQWRILNEATAILNSQLHSESLPLKFIKCAKKLVSAEEALLALEEEKDTGLKIFKHFSTHEEFKEELFEETVNEPKGAIEIILQKGVVIKRDSTQFSSHDLYGFSAIKKNLLGIPLYANGKVIGALLMANKNGEETFTQDDQELLLILGSQLGIALENSRLYEKVDEKLQTKVNELERVNEILLKQHKILTKSLEIHKQLTELALSGKGIEAICKTLTAFINSPVQVEDHNFNVKATTMDKLSNLFLSGRDLMERNDYAGQVKDLLEGRRPVEILLDANTIQYLVPIVAGEKILGLITTVLVNKTLKQLDQVAMEQGATIIALEMLKQRAAVEHSRRLKENFMEQVLEGDFESEEWVHHRALQLGFNLKNACQVMIVEIEPGEKDKSRPELYQEIREFCEDLFPSAIVVTKNNRILIMVSLDNKKQDGAKCLADLLKERLIQAVRNGNWWIALGTSCSKFGDCTLSYRKAVTTLEVMKALRLKNKIVANDSLGIFSLIEINPQRFAEFSQKTLGPLMEYDQKHKTQLVDTLNLYYKYNSNVLKASRKGYLNPSTVKYRLRRIQDITGLNLKNAEVSLQLQLAIKLIDFDCSDS
jgi:sugar diacid utilization regulator